MFFSALFQKPRQIQAFTPPSNSAAAAAGWIPVDPMGPWRPHPSQ